MSYTGFDPGGGATDDDPTAGLGGNNGYDTPGGFDDNAGGNGATDSFNDPTAGLSANDDDPTSQFASEPKKHTYGDDPTANLSAPSPTPSSSEQYTAPQPSTPPHQDDPTSQFATTDPTAHISSAGYDTPGGFDTTEQYATRAPSPSHDPTMNLSPSPAYDDATTNTYGSNRTAFDPTANLAPSPQPKATDPTEQYASTPPQTQNIPSDSLDAAGQAASDYYVAKGAADKIDLPGFHAEGESLAAAASDLDQRWQDYVDAINGGQQQRDPQFEASIQGEVADLQAKFGDYQSRGAQYQPTLAAADRAAQAYQAQLDRRNAVAASDEGNLIQAYQNAAADYANQPAAMSPGEFRATLHDSPQSFVGTMQGPVEDTATEALMAGNGSFTTPSGQAVARVDDGSGYSHWSIAGADNPANVLYRDDSGNWSAISREQAATLQQQGAKSNQFTSVANADGIAGQAMQSTGTQPTIARSLQSLGMIVASPVFAGESGAGLAGTAGNALARTIATDTLAQTGLLTGGAADVVGSVGTLARIGAQLAQPIEVAIRAGSGGLAGYQAFEGAQTIRHGDVLGGSLEILGSLMTLGFGFGAGASARSALEGTYAADALGIVPAYARVGGLGGAFPALARLEGEGALGKAGRIGLAALVEGVPGMVPFTPDALHHPVGFMADALENTVGQAIRSPGDFWNRVTDLMAGRVTGQDVTDALGSFFRQSPEMFARQQGLQRVAQEADPLVGASWKAQLGTAVGAMVLSHAMEQARGKSALDYIDPFQHFSGYFQQGIAAGMAPDEALTNAIKQSSNGLAYFLFSVNPRNPAYTWFSMPALEHVTNLALSGMGRKVLDADGYLNGARQFTPDANRNPLDFVFGLSKDSSIRLLTKEAYRNLDGLLPPGADALQPFNQFTRAAENYALSGQATRIGNIPQAAVYRTIGDTIIAGLTRDLNSPTTGAWEATARMMADAARLRSEGKVGTLAPDKYFEAMRAGVDTRMTGGAAIGQENRARLDAIRAQSGGNITDQQAARVDALKGIAGMMRDTWRAQAGMPLMADLPQQRNVVVRALDGVRTLLLAASSHSLAIQKTMDEQLRVQAAGGAGASLPDMAIRLRNAGRLQGSANPADQARGAAAFGQSALGRFTTEGAGVPDPLLIPETSRNILRQYIDNMIGAPTRHARAGLYQVAAGEAVPMREAHIAALDAALQAHGIPGLDVAIATDTLRGAPRPFEYNRIADQWNARAGAAPAPAAPSPFNPPAPVAPSFTGQSRFTPAASAAPSAAPQMVTLPMEPGTIRGGGPQEATAFRDWRRAVDAAEATKGAPLTPQERNRIAQQVVQGASPAGAPRVLDQFTSPKGDYRIVEFQSFGTTRYRIETNRSGEWKPEIRMGRNSLGNNPAQYDRVAWNDIAGARQRFEAARANVGGSGSNDETLLPWAKEGAPPRTATGDATGSATSIQMADGSQVPAQYRVVGLDDLKTNVPGIQTRPRDTSLQSVRQVEQIAKSLDPAELITPVRGVDKGPPIVGTDRAVESGNGRTMALRQARDGNTTGWQEYQRTLAAEAGRYGIDPAALAGVKDPVLVRENRATFATPEERRRFVDAANPATALARTQPERTASDLAAMTPDIIRAFDVQEGESLASAIARNDGAISRFSQNITRVNPNAAGEIADSSFRPTKQAYDRFAAALTAKAYGAQGVGLAERLMASTDEAYARIGNAVERSVPEMARAVARNPDANIGNELQWALDQMPVVRDIHRGNVAHFLDTPELGVNAAARATRTPEGEELLRFLWENRASQRAVEDGLRAYARLVPDASAPALFGGGQSFDKATAIREAFPARSGGGGIGEMAAGDGGAGYLSRQFRAIRDDLSGLGGFGGDIRTRGVIPNSDPASRLMTRLPRDESDVARYVATVQDRLRSIPEEQRVAAINRLRNELHRTPGEPAQRALQALAENGIRDPARVAAEAARNARVEPTTPFNASDAVKAQLDRIGLKPTEYTGIRTPGAGRNADLRHDFVSPEAQDAALYAQRPQADPTANLSGVTGPPRAPTFTPIQRATFGGGGGTVPPTPMAPTGAASGAPSPDWAGAANILRAFGQQRQALERSVLVRGDALNARAIGDFTAKSRLGELANLVYPFLEFHLNAKRVSLTNIAQHPLYGLGMLNYLQSNADEFNRLPVFGEYVAPLTKLYTGIDALKYGQEFANYIQQVRASDNNALQQGLKIAARPLAGPGAIAQMFPYADVPLQAGVNALTRPVKADTNYTGSTNWLAGGIRYAADRFAPDAHTRDLIRGVAPWLGNPAGTALDSAKQGGLQALGQPLKVKDEMKALPYYVPEIGASLGWDHARQQAAMDKPGTPDGQLLRNEYLKRIDRETLSHIVPTPLSDTGPKPQEKGVFARTPFDRNAPVSHNPGGSPGIPNFYENKAEWNGSNYQQIASDKEALVQARSSDPGIRAAGERALNAENNSAFRYGRDAGTGGRDLGRGVPAGSYIADKATGMPNGYYIESPEQARYQTARDQIAKASLVTPESVPFMDYNRSYLQNPDVAALAKDKQAGLTGEIAGNAKRTGAGLPQDQRIAQIAKEGQLQQPVGQNPDGTPFTLGDLLANSGLYNAKGAQAAAIKAELSRTNPIAADYLTKEDAAFRAQNDAKFRGTLTPAEQQGWDAFNDLRNSADYKRYSELEKQQRASGAFGSPEEKAWYAANKDELSRLTGIVTAAEKSIVDRYGANPKELQNRLAASEGKPATYTDTTIKGPGATTPAGTFTATSSTRSATGSASSASRPATSNSASRSSGTGSASTSASYAATQKAGNDFYDFYRGLTSQEKVAVHDALTASTSDVFGVKGVSAQQYEKALSVAQDAVKRQQERAGASSPYAATSSGSRAVNISMAEVAQAAKTGDWRGLIERHTLAGLPSPQGSQGSQAAQRDTSPAPAARGLPSPTPSTFVGRDGKIHPSRFGKAA